MSRALFSKNILREAQPSGSFLDQLQTIHAVTESMPAAKNNRKLLEQKFQEAFESGKNLGYIDGFASGEAKGIETGLEAGISQVRNEHEADHQEQIAQFSQDLAQILNETRQSVDRWFEESEQKLAVLAIEIAQRAISQELSLNQDAVVTIAKKVLQEVTSGNHVRLRVNPIQCASLHARQEEVMQAVSHIRGIEVVADPSIHNGLIVESETGVIDGRIESYLQRLTDYLTEEAA